MIAIGAAGFPDRRLRRAFTRGQQVLRPVCPNNLKRREQQFVIWGNAGNACVPFDERGLAPADGFGNVYALKGGIPAAPSGTATLLRLSPSH